VAHRHELPVSDFPSQSQQLVRDLEPLGNVARTPSDVVLHVQRIRQRRLVPSVLRNLHGLPHGSDAAPARGYEQVLGSQAR
jgi:hypothetical protein